MTETAGSATGADAVRGSEHHDDLQARADTLRRRGDLTGALACYREAGDLVCELSDAEQAAPRSLSTLALIRQKIAEVMVAQGELAGALDALREELELRRRLCALDPGNAEWREQVSRAAARAADLLVLKSGIATFRDGGSTETARRRSRDTSWALRSVGATLEGQGDLAGALALYREGLAVRREIAAQNPRSLECQFDVSWSLANLGRALAERGDLTGALASHNEALAIRRALAAREPGNPGRMLDVSWSLMAVGEALQQKGDVPGALAAYREALDIRRGLAAADPENNGLRCDMSASLARIAGVLAASGDRADALAACREARDIVGVLCAREPGRTEWRDDLAALDGGIAELAQTE